MCSRCITFGMFLSVALAGSTQAQSIRYVDDDAPSGGDGLSWSTAYNNLQDALSEALGDPSITEIRVAGGMYVPSVQTEPGVPRTETFQLINGVTLSGGYRGCPGGDCTSGDPDELDIALYESILSGDLNGDDDPGEFPDGPSFAENCYHVFYHSEGLNLDETAVLDGFTITGGNANNDFTVTSPHSYGGGMYNRYSNTTVTNCTFSANSAYGRGGGMSNRYSNPTVTNCMFNANSADGGGGMSNFDSDPVLAGCAFIANQAVDFAGGGVCNLGGSPTFADCTFRENQAHRLGGAIFNYESSPTIIRCAFSVNSVWGFAAVGGAISTSNSDHIVGLLLFSCVFQSNTASTYGGAVYYEGDSPWTAANCLFSGNAASTGGAVFNHASAPTLVNCTLTSNQANAAGGICNHLKGYPTLVNCILWDNRDRDGTSEAAQLYEAESTSPGMFYVDYSCVQGWTGQLGGVGNTGSDPLFVDRIGPDEISGTDDDDLRLLPASPCIDAGDNTALPPDEADLDGDGNTTEPIPLDLDGRNRFVDDFATPDTGNPSPEVPDRIVDMGAHEFPFCGDGIVDYSEECDEGGIDTSTCDADCSFAECGDATLNVSAGEECDDGNTAFGDGCNPYCRVETGRIPTVTGWGLTVMLLLLLTGAKVYFDRRRRLSSA